MLITTYTTYNEVRYVLGLSTQEMPDTQLSAALYANALSLSISEITVPATAGTGTFAAVFTEINAIAEASRTVNQQRFYDLARLYSTYVVAEVVCKSLPMTAPKMISDSKSSLTRFSVEATFRDVVKDIRSMVYSLKESIESIGSDTVTSLPYSFVIVPDVDPVTGE